MMRLDKIHPRYDQASERDDISLSVGQEAIPVLEEVSLS